MRRNDYDESTFTHSRNAKNLKKVYAITSSALIILIAIVFLVIYSSSESSGDVPGSAEETIIALAIPEVLPIAVERSVIASSKPERDEKDEEPEIIIKSAEDAQLYLFPPSDGEILFLDDAAIFKSPSGGAVYAVADGFVSDAGTDSEFGRFVTIMHSDGFKSSYYSLEDVSVKIGESVKKGEKIATAGSESSYSDEPILYFRLEQGSASADLREYF